MPAAQHRCRNPYPDHPAGPLPEKPDPAMVLDIGTAELNSWLLRCVAGGFLLTPLILLASTWPPKFPERALMVSMAGTAVAVALWKAADYLARPKPPMLRLRPDGIEFVRDGYPPLRWEDIDDVEMRSLWMGRGGMQDYLGIRLKPEARPTVTPYPRVAPTNILNFLGLWTFDACFHWRDFDRPIPHLVGEIRFRLDTSREAPLELPPGLTPLPGGPLNQRGGTAYRSVGWMLLSGSLILYGGFWVLAVVLNMAGVIPQTASSRAAQASGRSLESLLLIHGIVVGLGLLAWPGQPDDDED